MLLVYIRSGGHSWIEKKEHSDRKQVKHAMINYLAAWNALQMSCSLAISTAGTGFSGLRYLRQNLSWTNASAQLVDIPWSLEFLQKLPVRHVVKDPKHQCHVVHVWCKLVNFQLLEWTDPAHWDALLDMRYQPGQGYVRLAWSLPMGWVGLEVINLMSYGLTCGVG